MIGQIAGTCKDEAWQSGSLIQKIEDLKQVTDQWAHEIYGMAKNAFNLEGRTGSLATLLGYFKLEQKSV